MASGLFAAMSAWDWAALAVLLAGWLGASWYIESGPRATESMSAIMDRRRFDWMARMAERDQRIFDAALLTSLQNGAAFFASASLLAVGGAVALIGEMDRLMMVAADLPLAEPEPRAVWEIKLLVLTGMVSVAFLKFAWTTRLFSYCAVMMGAVPHAGEPDSEGCARQAAVLCRQAARSFNRGLRALYFALAALGWLLGSWACMLGVVMVIALIYRREFLSRSRQAMV